MTILPKNREIFAVLDTMVFVRAVASLPDEARFYAMAIRKCWKFVFSDHITEQYQAVMNKYGHSGTVIQLELAKLGAMNKYRVSMIPPESISLELAPRKDRHVVAPCVGGIANVLVTEDGGILEKRGIIKIQTGAHVVTMQEAVTALTAMPDCPSR
jgi:predicted nucleic acid-binding protein